MFRRAHLAVVVLVLSLSAATTTAGVADVGNVTSSDRSPRTLRDLEHPADRALRSSIAATALRTGEDAGPPTSFTGLDGLLHLVSPVPIAGKNGYYYIGADFDSACAFGAHLETALKHLSRLADILEKRGKRVLFTVTPNKSVVLKDDLPDTPPQGECSRRGMRIQAKLLDHYRDPRYLPLRKPLAKAPHAYWRTDSHWNTVGTSIFAEAVARALDPRLASQQRYRRTERTHRGDLSYYVPGLGEETDVARVPDNGVRTSPARGSVAYDPSLQSVYTDLSWKSKPARKTYPGRTLIVGDSFSYVATEAMSNLFHKGRFMWLGFQNSMPELADPINRADTVIFTVVQRFATITPLADPAFQNYLKTYLNPR